MHQLVYRSIALDEEYGEADLDILLTALTFNRQNGITGFLWRGRGQFFQALHGPRVIVVPLMERIKADPRHSDVEVLMSEDTDQPTPFNDWAMGYDYISEDVLGVALARASGESLLTLARARLGDPLEIEIPAWVRDPQGHYLGGNEMALSPRAMLRFGEMTRLDGLWQGRRVLSRDWVAASMVARTRSPWSGLSYGYGWFLGHAGGARMALARGYGGQLVCVLPERAMTIAITSDPTRPARSGGYFGDLMELIGEIVASA